MYVCMYVCILFYLYGIIEKIAVMNKTEKFAVKIGLVHTYKLSCLKLVVETGTVSHNDKVPGTIP